MSSRVVSCCALLGALVLHGGSGTRAQADTLDFEGLRFEVPEGFSSVGHDAVYFRQWFQRQLELPDYYRPDEAEFRLVQRVSEAEDTDLVIVARVPGESRSADDPVLERTFCSSFARDPEDVLGPVECGLRTTSRGVVGIDVRLVARSAGGPATRCLFLLLRSDDLVALFVELPGNRRAEAEAIWSRLLDTLENVRPLPPASKKWRDKTLGTSVLVVLGLAVVFIAAWKWWLRRADRWRPRGARGRRAAPKRV